MAGLQLAICQLDALHVELLVSLNCRGLFLFLAVSGFCAQFSALRVHCLLFLHEISAARSSRFEYSDLNSNLKF